MGKSREEVAAFNEMRCQCGVRRWKHSKWAPRVEREEVLKAHLAAGLVADVEQFFESLRGKSAED